MTPDEKRIVGIADKVGNFPAPQIMLDALPDEDRRSVIEVLTERAKFERFMTLTWCAVAVAWVWILSGASFELPTWVRPVSSVALVLLILISAASWWSRRRVLKQSCMSRTQP